MPKRQETTYATDPFEGLDITMNDAMRVIDVLTVEKNLLSTISDINGDGDYAFIVPLQKCTQNLREAIDRSLQLSHYGLRLLDLLSDHQHASISEGKTVKEQEDNDDDEVEITSHFDELLDKMKSLFTLLRGIHTNVIDVIAQMTAAHTPSIPTSNESAVEARSRPQLNAYELFYDTLRGVIIRNLGRDIHAEDRANGLIKCLESLAMFRTYVNVIQAAWYEELECYADYTDSRKTKSDGGKVTVPVSFDSVYDFTARYIEQVQKALLVYPQYFTQTTSLFSGHGAGPHVRTPPAQWDFRRQHVEFPTHLISRSLTTERQDHIETDFNATIVEVIRTGSGKYDLYLKVTAQRNFRSGEGQPSRCVSMSITWRFAYPPGSVSNAEAPGISGYLPEFQRAHKSAKKVTKSLGATLSPSAPGLASIGELTAERMTEITIPGWASIRGVAPKDSADGSPGIKWHMTENSSTATGDDRCTVRVSLELARPAHEIISEVIIETLFAPTSGLRSILPFNKESARVTGNQRINLLSLRTKAIMNQRGMA